MTSNSAEGIKWNLSDLFAAHNDPQIELTLKTCHARAAAFAKRFRPQMEQPNALTADILLRALDELEAILRSSRSRRKLLESPVRRRHSKARISGLGSARRATIDRDKKPIALFRAAMAKVRRGSSQPTYRRSAAQDIQTLSFKPASLSTAYALRARRKSH